MNSDGVHYERAFEAYLQQRRLSYVAVNQARRAIFDGVRLKSFDFLIYPPAQMRILADVKGRRLELSAYQRGRLGESWVTIEDVDGLKRWQEVFGRSYRSIFVFAYWLHGEPVRRESSTTISLGPLRGVIDTPAQPELPDVFSFQGRLYAFKAVELNAYRLGMKLRSASWRTVYVPRRIFRHVVGPLDNFIRPQRKKAN